VTGKAETGLPLGSPGHWRVFLLIAFLATLAGVLRLAGISLESLDPDEVFSYRVATAGVPHAFQIIRQDLVHPPFFYCLLQIFVWIAGASAMSIRAVSLMAGIGTVTLLVYAGYLFRELRTASWASALLLAANNTHIFYSQQARSAAVYTLLVAALLLWSWLLASRNDRSPTFWVAGGVLMAVIIFTHYVGTIYVICVAGCLALGPKSSIVRKRLCLVTVAAGLTFVPWLALESQVYIHKRGLAENLDWVASPTLYHLKLLWANYMGVPDFPGATTLVLILGSCFIGFGLVFRERTPLVTTALLTLAATALIPPILVFALSQKPLGLPVFGERHLLPSIVGWIMLVAYGLDRIASRLAVRRVVYATGLLILLALQLAPTIAAVQAEPRRLSYADIANDVRGATPVYATSAYDVADPVSFYLGGRQTVTVLPCWREPLPATFILLYRPAIPSEQQQLTQLKDYGWTITQKTDYTNATHSPGYVRVARLHRTRLVSELHPLTCN
jgi:4-amino-4-deoxy-L-arabinose transferase-like glycosyltransferase